MMQCHQPTRAAEDGFTLLETLVTLVILSVAVLLFERTLAGSFHGISAANQRSDAVTLALRKLDEAGSDAPLADGGETDGQDGRYQWTLRVEPVDTDTESARTEAHAVLPYWVDVVVRWRDGFFSKPVSVHFRRLRLERHP